MDFRTVPRFALATRLCGVALIVSLLSSVATASTAAVTSQVVRLTNIGGLPLGVPFSDAIRHFGPAGGAGATQRFIDGGCTVRYPALGLSLWYVGNPLLKGTPQTCRYFQSAAVSGPGWHTANGLAVGDTTMKLRHLFPHVYNTRHPGPKWDSPRGSIQWDITITCCGGGRRPALYAMVKGGRIAALGIQMVGH